MDKEIESMESDILPKRARDIGLQFFTTEERGWPQGKFTLEDLTTGIYHNKYKFTFTDNNYSEENVLELIKNEDNLLKECWNTIEIDTFRKTRPGCIQERSPPEPRDPRLKTRLKL